MQWLWLFQLSLQRWRPKPWSPSSPKPGDAAIASCLLINSLHNMAMPCAGQVLVQEDYLPRMHWHAELFSNVQSWEGRVAPTTSQLCKQVSAWGGLALLQETVSAQIGIGCSHLQFTLQKLTELWKWRLLPPAPCPTPQAPKGKAVGHLGYCSGELFCLCPPHWHWLCRAGRELLKLPLCMLQLPWHCAPSLDGSHSALLILASALAPPS